MNLLIKNARIVDYSQDFIGDIYIENGNIKEVGLNINVDTRFYWRYLYRKWKYKRSRIKY